MPSDPLIVKTMRSSSYSRQKTAVELAQQADVVILLDDGGGAAQSVFEVCSRVNKRVYRVRSKDRDKAGLGKYGIYFGAHRIASLDLTNQQGVGHVSEQVSGMSPD
jgi:hypothetical protein